MTYQELLQKSRSEYRLDEATINYMLKYYLKVNVGDNYVTVSKDKIEEYFKKLGELQEGQPIQYIVGDVDFYGYNFKVNPGVLIPRFETEELVYYTKEYINKHFKDSVSLIDVGTGSGVIGLSLKKEINNLKVTMTDISPEAIKLALNNAIRLNEDVTIYESDMLSETIKRREKYDIIISNPPYLMEDEEVMDVVKKYEPHLALYGGDGGLKYYKILLANAKSVLNDRGIVAFEIGATQAQDIKKIANQYFAGSEYEIKKDLEGRDRMFFLFYNLAD